jgi:glycosyltransferase involved in cell wall biosynthesis
VIPKCSCGNQLQDLGKHTSAIRVAFFNVTDVGSGAESLIRLTVEGLIARGIDARLYVTFPITTDRYVFRIPLVRYERQIEPRLRVLTGWNDLFFPSTWRLGRHAWLKNADLWHFHNLHGHYVSLPVLARESRRRPIILSPVDQFLSTGYCPYTLGCLRYQDSCGSCPQLDLPYPGISRDATATLLRMKKSAVTKSGFDVLVHTDFLARHYRSTFVNTRPITRLHYGIDTNVFRPMDRKQCAEILGLKYSSRFVVGIFHSNILEERKGFLPLLERLRQLADRMPGVLEVLVVGKKSEHAQDFKTLNLPVTTLPYIRDQVELARAINLCDVLLYPTQAENLSLTCLDAMSCGVPVISSDVGGQGEAIDDGVNGYLCAAEDSARFIDRIAALAKDSTLQRRLSAQARRIVLERFDINSYVDNLIVYYNQVLQKRTT